MAAVTTTLTGAECVFTQMQVILNGIVIQIKPLTCTVLAIDTLLVDYSLVFPALDGELWPFVGDLFSGRRLMEGVEIFSANGHIWTGLVTFWGHNIHLY